MKTIGIVIPCYNEEAGIPSLELVLHHLEDGLKTKGYDPRWIFIDDGSTDGTFALLQKIKLSGVIVKRHLENKNLGAALRTGIAACAGCEIVCSLDSDCTYDPAIVFDLLKKIEAGADLATASPYHPLGAVDGVPRWRLLLSKTLSLLYRKLTGSTIHTYTALARAQRMKTVASTLSARNDFTFLAEVLLNSLRQKLKVEEVPAILRTRKFGVSKMKTLRTILRHIELIVQFLLNRTRNTA